MTDQYEAIDLNTLSQNWSHKDTPSWLGLDAFVFRFNPDYQSTLYTYIG